MTDEEKEAKKAAKKAKAEAKREAKREANSDGDARAAETAAKAERERTGVRAGAQPDHETKHKIRLRTQGGHKLYLPAIEFWAPGKETKLEVTAAQLEHLKLDGRIMIDGQIDDYKAEIADMKNRKAVGTRFVAPRRTKVPGLPVNYPGGERMPKVKLPAGAKTAKELVSEEQAFLDKEARDAKRRGKRAS